MVLVDSSVWIDYFNGTPSAEADLLTGDLILGEVLRGFERAADFRRASSLMAKLFYEDMLGKDVALRSVGYYRALRRRGITVRKTIDVFIATFCILRGHSLLHRDRDFAPFARFGLVTASS